MLRFLHRTENFDSLALTAYLQFFQWLWITYLLLLFFLLGAFLIGITGHPVALLVLAFGVFVILGALAGLIGNNSSSIRRCFSLSTFFFFFLSFFSFFFFGFTMGPWDRAVSCSCTALSWWVYFRLKKGEWNWDWKNVELYNQNAQHLSYTTKIQSLVQTCSCSSASRFALSSSESELGLLSLSSLSLLSSLSDDEDEDDEDEELGGAGGSSGILAKQNSKTSWKNQATWVFKIIT